MSSGHKEGLALVTGITPEHIEVVRKTFDKFRGDPKGLGSDLFLSLFEAHPEHVKAYPAYAGISLAELAKNKRFVALTATVVYNIMSVIDNLDDKEVLVELLLRLGRTHARINVGPEAFQNLKGVFMTHMKNKLDSDFTPFAEESWSKTLDVMNSIIFVGIEEGKKGAK